MLGGETVGPRGPLKGGGQVASVFGYFSQLAISPGGAVNVANLFEDLPGALVPSLGLIQKIFFMKQDAQLAAFVTGALPSSRSMAVTVHPSTPSSAPDAAAGTRKRYFFASASNVNTASLPSTSPS